MFMAEVTTGDTVESTHNRTATEGKIYRAAVHRALRAKQNLISETLVLPDGLYARRKYEG